MRIIDAHIHFVPNSSHFARIAVRAGHENTQKHLIKTFDELNIAHAVVMGNRSLAADAHDYPDFLSYCIGLDRSVLDVHKVAAAAEQAENHLCRKNCVGIKLYAGYCPFYLTDEVYAPFFSLAERYQKPVAVHTGVTASGQALLKYSHPLVLDDVATRYPKINFVMCHMGNPWVIDAAAVLEKNDNVYADLSGLLVGRIDLEIYHRDQKGYVDYLRTWIAYVENYDKFLYGTDWPLVNMAEYVELIASLIPEKHLDKIFFENANRIYDLGL